MTKGVKDKIKVAGISSPAIAALLMFPTETFTFLKTLREAGIELPMIIVFFLGVFWIRRDAIKVVDVRLGDISDNVKKLSDEQRISNEQNARQFSEGAKIMQTQSQQIRFIMTHLQLNIPDQTDKPKDQDLTP